MGTSTRQPYLVLASQSPRRIELLKMLGLSFEVLASNVDELIDPTLPPAELVVKLAKQKSAQIAKRLNDKKSAPFVVLGADTLVVSDGKYLGKPATKEDAFHMLASLSGKVHEVYTGVSLIGNINRPEGVDESIFQTSRVYFRELATQEINAYIATGEPMDKAGAYAVQGIASAFIDKIEGCYTNIIGLPIPLVVLMLRKAGIEVLGK